MEKPIMNEELKLQHECWMWFHNEMQLKYPAEKGKYRRIKNELDGHGTRGIAQMKQLNENKLTGIVAGTWDSFYMRYPMTWIEFKTAKGILSDAQKEFRDIGRELGHEFWIIRNLEQFKTMVNEFTQGE